MFVCDFLCVVFLFERDHCSTAGGISTKDVETKNKFLELRARGTSLRTIEKEIGTGRHTLAKWESECKEELENLEAIELEALREKYRLTAQARIERYGGQLRRVTEELKGRDLFCRPNSETRCVGH